MENILQFLERDKNGPRLKIAVLGDSMIDEYFDVQVKRISPEYPIPIIQTECDDPQVVPGGAANVVCQFGNFNADVSLVSLIDQEAVKIFAKSGIEINSACQIIENKIPRKKRFFSDNFQVSRIDFEKQNYGLSDNSLQNIVKSLLSCFRKQYYQAVVFSDYGKGIFNYFDNSVLKKFPITIVDPKNGDIEKWKGCTVFKPNREEALRLSGKKTVFDAGIYLSEFLGSSVVITEAAKGVSIFDNGVFHEIRPDISPAVAESVIGAGDCFVAFLAMFLVRGFSLFDSSEMAFKAGTLYVLNKRNKPITKHDLLFSIDHVGSKIISFNDCGFLRDRNFKLVFTNGCFDILHRGHIESLKFAKSQGDKLVVGVNSDSSVGKLKDGRPINSVSDRISLLASCEYVDYVIVFEEDTPLELIKKIVPDVVVKGEDYKEKDIIGHGIVPEIKRCPLVEGISTTKIIEKIKKI